MFIPEEVANLRAFNASVEEARSLLMDGLPLDVEHEIDCHADTLAIRYRMLCAAVSKALDELTKLSPEIG